MKYQLTVKNTSTQELISKIATSGNIPKLDIVSIFDIEDNLTEVTFSVDLDSSKIESFENQLDESALDPESDVLDWNKLDD